jgi:colicin import membrane protein
MDSFNSNFSPFDSSDQEQDRKNREEAERQKQEAEKLAKQKAEQAERQKKAEAESAEAPEKRESFFSIKSRAEKATEKASKNLNKNEKSDPKKLTSEIAKDEDNFSEDERALIKLKKEAIADRAKQLTEQSQIPENSESKSKSHEGGANEPQSLSQEEALSLAIAEALSGDLDEIEPTISESEPTKLGDILLAAATKARIR